MPIRENPCQSAAKFMKRILVTGHERLSEKSLSIEDKADRTRLVGRLTGMRIKNRMR